MLRRAILDLIESILRNIGGGVGIRLRYLYYRNRLLSCGTNVRIDVGVIFENPENIVLGSNVLILPYTMLTAAKPGMQHPDRIIVEYDNPDYECQIGAIVIGDEVGIGAYNILHGYGGLVIEDKVTTSARVSLYSFSHYYNDPKQPEIVTYANAMVDGPISCVRSPVVIREGVWLALGVQVFGGTVGKNSFVTANSIVINNLDENSYAKGIPAKKIKDRFANRLI